MTLPDRSWQAEGYRYGFQGQEADDELFGEDIAINYTFRMHDARIGRFLSIDPLAAKYPFWSPYNFSGNMVIQYRELEGLEPTEGEPNYGVNIVLGGPQHEYAISDTRLAMAGKGPNDNWTYFEAQDFSQAAEQVKALSAAGIQIKNIVINGHGHNNQILYKTDGGAIYDQRQSMSRSGISGFKYMTLYHHNDEEGRNGLYLADPGWKADYEAFENLKSIMGCMQEGGNLIFGTCNSGNTLMGQRALGEALYELGEGRINIFLNKSYTRNPVDRKTGVYVNTSEQYLEVGLTTKDNFHGWTKTGPETGGYQIPLSPGSNELFLQSNDPEPFNFGERED